MNFNLPLPTILQYRKDNFLSDAFVRSPLHNAVIPVTPSCVLKSRTRVNRDLFICRRLDESFLVKKKDYILELTNFICQNDLVKRFIV